MAMAVGLFAHIGLIAHLYALLLPAVAAQLAGSAMGFAMWCSIGGRWIVVRLMPPAASLAAGGRVL